MALTAGLCDNITDMQLRGAMLCVKDMERMTQFYRDVLGVEPTNRTDAWVAFDAGGVEFALHAIPADIAGSVEIANPPAPRENEPVKLIFAVDDVEGKREQIESLGLRTIRRPWQNPGEACDAMDPEGNIFQLCSSRSLTA